MSERTLLFDCETTGKVDFKASPSAPYQPRIVQLAAMLVEGESELASLNVVFEPDNYLIPVEASNIHGVTTARAYEIGVPIAPVLETFLHLIDHADWIVGHNVAFDIYCANIEFYKHNHANPFLEKATFCTMKSSTDICRLTGPYGYKWPKLSEVYQFAFGEELQKAHNAMLDLRATLRVYNWLKNKTAERTVAGMPV